MASRPPIPPFSGSTSKSLCGIKALSAVTRVDVVSFVEREKLEESECAFAEFWHDHDVGIHWVAYGKQSNSLNAALTGRFQFGSRLKDPDFPILLEELDWQSSARLLIFDDIVMAPLLKRYGKNSILSPHDCMSKMCWSHFRSSPPGIDSIRYLLRSLISRRYERSFYHLSLLTHIITQRDRVWLEKINPKARYEVVPNSDMLNPGFSASAPNAWDVLVWGDLRISSIAQGTRAFLSTVAKDKNWLESIRLLVAGRVSTLTAQKIIGADLLSRVVYVPYLENDKGQLQHAKITVIPDVGGAGIKNRCVNMLSSGKCLACLYPQMEGVEKACDRGAINAITLTELVSRIKKALYMETWLSYAQIGKMVFERENNESANRQLWSEMVERAVAIRSGIL